MLNILDAPFPANLLLAGLHRSTTISLQSWRLPLTVAVLLSSLQLCALSAPHLDRHLAAGKEFGIEGKWKEAESELRAYEQAHPDLIEAVTLHAEALVKMGQPFDAALDLRDFLQRHPDALRAHELYAVLAAGPLRDVNLAIHELEICVKLSPKDFQAWKSLAEAYQDQTKTDQEIHALRQAERLRPNDAEVAASLARAYGDSGDATKAEAEFNRAAALAVRPGQSGMSAAAVDYLRGQYLAEHGSGSEGVIALTKALAFNPNSADAYYWRARAYQKNGDREHALADALKSLELAPSNKEAALFLITQYRKAGDMENAQKYAELAQKITDEEQAEQTFARSLRDTLDKAEPLLREGKFADAIPLYESILQKLPTFYEAYFDLGNCYAQTGRLPDAEASFRKYLSFQPVSADGHAALGMVLAEQERGPDAISELTQALKIDPSLVEVRKALANLDMQAGGFKAAVEVLRHAGNAHDAQAETMLAIALDKTGDRLSALTAVNRALAIDSADAQALQLRRELLASPAAAKP